MYRNNIHIIYKTNCYMSMNKKYINWTQQIRQDFETKYVNWEIYVQTVNYVKLTILPHTQYRLLHSI